MSAALVTAWAPYSYGLELEEYIRRYGQPGLYLHDHPGIVRLMFNVNNTVTVGCEVELEGYKVIGEEVIYYVPDRIPTKYLPVFDLKQTVKRWVDCAGQFDYRHNCYTVHVLKDGTRVHVRGPEEGVPRVVVERPDYKRYIKPKGWEADRSKKPAFLSPLVEVVSP